MIVLLNAYKLTVIGGLLGGAALALIGSQLASRNQSVQTLVISQAAALGTIIGLIINVLLGHDHGHEFTIVPAIYSFSIAALFYIICEIVISNLWPSRNTYFVGIFGLLLSLTYTVISLVPGLETHMAASYFGDLALASDFESLTMSAVGMIGLLFFCIFWRQVTSWSFNSVTFGLSFEDAGSRKIQAAFVTLALVTISVSIQLLGLLFTISCLFLPTMVLARARGRFNGFPLRIVLATSAGVVFGFLLSLWHGEIPTVPCIALALFFSSLFVSGVTRH